MVVFSLVVVLEGKQVNCQIYSLSPLRSGAKILYLKQPLLCQTVRGFVYHCKEAEVREDRGTCIEWLSSLCVCPLSQVRGQDCTQFFLHKT